MLAPTEDRLAAAERHLSDGEARLEAIASEVAPLGRAEGGPHAGAAQARFRAGVAETRRRVAALRAGAGPAAGRRLLAACRTLPVALPHARHRMAERRLGRERVRPVRPAAGVLPARHLAGVGAAVLAADAVVLAPLGAV